MSQIGSERGYKNDEKKKKGENLDSFFAPMVVHRLFFFTHRHKKLCKLHRLRGRDWRANGTSSWKKREKKLAMSSCLAESFFRRRLLSSGRLVLLSLSLFFFRTSFPFSNSGSFTSDEKKSRASRGRTARNDLSEQVKETNKHFVRIERGVRGGV